MKIRKLVRHSKRNWRKLEKDANELFTTALEKKSLCESSDLVIPEFVLDRSNQQSIVSKKIAVSRDLQSKAHRGTINAEKVLLTRLSKQAPRPVDIQRRYPRESDFKQAVDKNKDVWETLAESDDEHGIKTHFLRTTRQKRIKVHKRYGAKVTSLPAVPLPAPGASYNPTLNAHRSLLEKEAHVQALLDRQETRLAHQLDSFFPLAGQAPTDVDYLEEMEAGLFDDEDDDDDHQQSSIADDVDNILSSDKITSIKKKTRAQRNKLKHLKAKLVKRTYRDAAKRIEKDLKNVDSLAKKIRKDEVDLVKRRKQRKESQAAIRQERPYRRLGPHKLPPREESVLLPQELTPSLRQLRPMSDGGGTPAEALQDTLQRRGIIEPRHRVKALKARYKPKRFAKSSTREELAPRRVSQRSAAVVSILT